ncbi:hypothetical protein GA433_21675 [Bacteroides xylanisolvens]|nr:hypothetical protein GA433_21675 [Bacteroides xylanisolvens]
MGGFHFWVPFSFIHQLVPVYTMVYTNANHISIRLNIRQIQCGKVRLSLKPWGIALKFLFLHHENILFPND